jgi:hypothetical protein
MAENLFAPSVSADARRAWGAACDQERASTRPGRKRLWLVAALCLLAASAVPPAAGAEQGQELPPPPVPPALVGKGALTLSADRTSPLVGQRLHLTATLSPAGADPVTGALVKLSLPSGLDLLSADPVSASLGSWSVPSLSHGQTQTLTLVVRATAAGAHTASVQLQDGTKASVTVTAHSRHARRRHARRAVATT